MSSDPTVVSYPVSRGRRGALPPRPTMTCRSARSLMSITRFHCTLKGSMSSRLKPRSASAPSERRDSWYQRVGRGGARQAEALHKADGAGGLALPQWRGGDGGDIDVLAAGTARDPFEHVEMHLRLI